MAEPESSTRTERIDLRHADDPRDVIHRAVACLVEGGVVGLPTEAGYALAASALRPLAVSRLVREASADNGGSLPLRLGVKSAEELDDWAANPSLVASRLARRSWPGPLALALDTHGHRGLLAHLPTAVRSALTPDHQLVLRCPDHPATLDILQLVPGPLVLVEEPSLDASPWLDPDVLVVSTNPDMLLDGGAFSDRRELTLVRAREESWSLLREGSIVEDELLRRSGIVLLFVCTGNTCRSPMAEAICRDVLANRLECPVDEVTRRGYVVLSAGVSTYDGMPASEEAVEVIRDRGGSLRHHTSRRLTPELVLQADLILAMTASHRDTVLAYFPESVDRVRLLDPEGGNLDDPIGCDFVTYRRTAEQIESHLAHLLDELGV